MSYDLYTGILKMMDKFQDMNTHIDFKYGYDDTASKKLKSKYHIDEISKEGSTLSKAVNLLDWLSGHTFHVPDYDGHITNNALDLLEYSYDNGEEYGINCRSLSITLSECCLAVGLKARAVYMVPLSPYECDNHVVCEVFIPEKSKWAMLDPTFNGYIMDEDDNICSVLELRQALANRMKLKFYNKTNYNGDYDVNFKELEEYYAKDLFYLQCREIHNFNSEQMEGNRIITYAPVGYDVKKSLLLNIEFRAANHGNDEYLQKRRNSIKKNNIIYKSENMLKESPF